MARALSAPERVQRFKCAPYVHLVDMLGTPQHHVTHLMECGGWSDDRHTIIVLSGFVSYILDGPEPGDALGLPLAECLALPPTPLPL